MRTGIATQLGVVSGGVDISSEPTAALVIITTTPFVARSRTYGFYEIPTCRAGEPYVTLTIRAAKGVIDLGDKRRQEYVIAAIDVATDLARDCNSDLWGVGGGTFDDEGQPVHGFAGVFVADGAEPTAEELEQAHELLRRSDELMITRAHAEWDQLHRPDTIHDSWKRAARRRGVEAPWLYSIGEFPNCPHCGAKLLAVDAKVCATCTRDVGEVAARAKAKARPARKKEAAATA